MKAACFYSISNSRGTTLVMVLISAAISALICLTTVALVNATQKSFSSLLNRSSRDDLRWTLQRVLTEERAVAATVSHDPVFAACFKTGPAAAACPPQVETGISIYDSSGVRVSGPPTNPVYYAADGSRCDGGKTACAIEVISAVRPQSLPIWTTHQLDPAPAGRYEMVEVRYTIRATGARSFSLSAREVHGSYVIDLLDTELSYAPN